MSAAPGIVREVFPAFPCFPGAPKAASTPAMASAQISGREGSPRT